MTLQEAVIWPHRVHDACGEFEDEEICEGVCGQTATAIATILNAVVKGELK